MQASATLCDRLEASKSVAIFSAVAIASRTLCESSCRYETKVNLQDAILDERSDIPESLDDNFLGYRTLAEDFPEIHRVNDFS